MIEYDNYNLTQVKYYVSDNTRRAQIALCMMMRRVKNRYVKILTSFLYIIFKNCLLL